TQGAAGSLTLSAAGVVSIESAISLNGSINISGTHVVINGARSVATTGSGAILITAIGATTNTIGIAVVGQVSAENGQIYLFGNGGSVGDQNIGIVVGFGGSVTTTGAGNISLIGGGGVSSGSFNYGIDIQDNSAVGALGSGSISIVGAGGGSGASSNTNIG